MKPNFITILGFLSGIVGGYLYLNGYFILGSVLFVIFNIFDNVDGEVARYRKLCSALGGWLDTMAGHLLYPYFFFTLGLGIYFQTGIFLYVILGSIAAMVKLIERSVPQLLIQRSSRDLLKGRKVVSIKIWASHIAKNTVLYSIILLCSIVGWEIYFLWFFAIYLIFLALGKVFLTGWRVYHSQ